MEANVPFPSGGPGNVDCSCRQPVQPGITSEIPEDPARQHGVRKNRSGCGYTLLAMALSSGYRLGQYEVLALLGAGGMGEVYRARDTKLVRDVALKVLPEVFALDPERLARFKREAQVLASLNHPHIAHVYGLEESGGTIALVMELVDGEDLSQRLTRGPIPIDEALRIHLRHPGARADGLT